MGFPKTQGTLLHCRPFHLDNHAEDVCILKVSGFVDVFFADVHPEVVRLQTRCGWASYLKHMR